MTKTGNFRFGNDYNANNKKVTVFDNEQIVKKGDNGPFDTPEFMIKF